MTFFSWLRGPPGADRPRALVQPVYGLANRLRGVTSTLAVARRYRLRFAMLWEPGQGFSDDAWGDLFANEYERIDRAEFDRALADGTPHANPWAEAPHDAAEVRRRIRDAGFVYENAHRNLDALVRRQGIKLHGCRTRRRRCCRELRPAPPLAAEIDAFAGRHFAGRRVVGVHIRRGDAVTGPFREQYLPSTDDAFVAAMKRCGPRTFFFLATDCAQTQERFVAELPGRVLTRDKAWVPSEFGVEKTGQQDAVVDLFLLARTRRVIGTRWSTFGEAAADIGGIRFEVAVRSGPG